MKKDREIVIIGCGAGGGTAAQFARKTDRKSKITIFEKEKYPQYSKCGLPYFISGDIPKLKNLIEFSEEWFKKENIELILHTTVEEIDNEKQIISARKGNSIIEKPFNLLIIATGAKPIVPPIQNIYKNGTLIKGVHVLRTLEDAKQIYSLVQKGKKATIIGAGLIGLEMAHALIKKGMNVTLVETLPNILSNTLDQDMCEPILKKLNEKIILYTEHLATKVVNNNGKIKGIFIKDNKTNEEKRIETDITIIAAGSKPDVSLGEKLGCKLGENGGILVNDRAETSVKNIYAVGDCTEYYDFITKEKTLVGLGSIAVRQGITAGTNSAGGNYKLPKGILQTRTSEFFNIELAAVGPTSPNIKSPIVEGKFKGSSLPSYYPGGKPIDIKVIVEEKTGKILAAQAVGKNAALRINTFVSAIINEMKVEEFRKLETAYAPPVAPTLDPITIACDVASMKLNRRRR